MGKAKAPTDGAPKAARPEIIPLVYADQCEKELLRAKQFGNTWGELAKGPCPKSVQDALEKATAEMATIEAKLAPNAARTATFVTNTMASYPQRANQGSLEAGLGKAYKVLRAGI